jgi:hypothetical protein
MSHSAMPGGLNLAIASGHSPGLDISLKLPSRFRSVRVTMVLAM